MTHAQRKQGTHEDARAVIEAGVISHAVRPATWPRFCSLEPPGSAIPPAA